MTRRSAFHRRSFLGQSRELGWSQGGFRVSREYWLVFSGPIPIPTARGVRESASGFWFGWRGYGMWSGMGFVRNGVAGIRGGRTGLDL